MTGMVVFVRSVVTIVLVAVLMRVSHILYWFQIPVIGIVDGDEEVILKNGHFTPGPTYILMAEPI
ncbi:MAG: hypothetical protein ISS63_12220 [Desulfobacteraceae bacterium]|nr:hypothetical protein [Desulfobacteraceae bacterium]